MSSSGARGRMAPDASVGTVAHIFIAAKRGAPMQSLRRAEAVTESGLAGDRYSNASIRRGPDYQFTLIELENIRAFEEATGHVLAPDAPRRNIVTTGIALNALVGQRFRVGEVLAEGLELCEPCSLFKKRTYPEALRFFVGKGGLRARIAAGGVIAVGDSLVPVPMEKRHGKPSQEHDLPLVRRRR
jgi:MOSC domain-containing protein YiiM